MRSKDLCLSIPVPVQRCVAQAIEYHSVSQDGRCATMPDSAKVGRPAGAELNKHSGHRCRVYPALTAHSCSRNVLPESASTVYEWRDQFHPAGGSVMRHTDPGTRETPRGQIVRCHG